MVASAMAWLVVETEQDEQSCQIGSSTTIGRDRSCALLLRDPGASRRQCTIRRRGAELWLQDDNSTNGTQVNGVLVKGEVRLENEDRIQIGATSIRVLDQPPVPRAQAQAQAPAPLPVARRRAELDPDRTIMRTLEAPERVVHDLGPSIENGLLFVGRDGDLRVQLWNVSIDQGGFFLRIPLLDERPPSSRLHRYASKGRPSALVLEPGDEAFEALLAEAQRDLGALPERALVERLTDLVYRTLGGLLPQRRIDACLSWCAAQRERPVRIGELIRMGAGVCRHRAFLFFHLAQRLGLRAELYRGSVADSRHAWNVVRVEGQRVFVDATLNLVLDHPRDAEEAHGYQASRHYAPRPDAPLPQGHLVVASDSDDEQVEVFRFRHEIRKVPGDEEAVLLLYPEGEMPAVRYLHVHLRIGAAAVAMFALDPFVSARVFSIVGDEAHHRMDALDRDAVPRLRSAWLAKVDPLVEPKLV